MELSGEAAAGYFFLGASGPQFASHQALRQLTRRLPEDRVWWVNAVDPASPCGLGLEAFQGRLPKRVEGSLVAFCGPEVVLVSERKGKALTFHTPPDAPRLVEYLAGLTNLLGRRFKPLRRIKIETINGDQASASPYVDALRTCFEVMIEYKDVILYRQEG